MIRLLTSPFVTRSNWNVHLTSITQLITRHGHRHLSYSTVTIPSTQPSIQISTHSTRRSFYNSALLSTSAPPTRSTTRTTATPTTPPTSPPVDPLTGESTSASPPLPFAVVGSGPAAFYTTKYLLRECPNIKVDMFERLPVPYGLVRFGVAPDHPDVKSVIHDFETVANDTRFQFWGNVEIGKDVSLDELRQHYSGVILAYGAASERTLNIPGSHLKGIHPSRHFVNWYNAHPEHNETVHDFELSRVQTAVIIGQGNVAIDCARILLASPERLKNTDIASYAFDHLSTSKISTVHMIGRRGAVQSAFSIGELRELATNTDGMRVLISADDFAASENPSSLSEIEASRPKKRKHELMKEVVSGHYLQSPAHSSSSSPRELHIRYLLNPKEFKPSEQDPTRVGAIVLEKTELRGPPEKQEAVPTGETITVPTELVLTSIGYRSLPIPGLPFDTQKHIVPNQASRVQNLKGEFEPGLYVAGWLKRGPSGIIATNIMDARETVKSITHDLKEGIIQEPKIGTPLPFLSPASLTSHQVVSRLGWSRIDSIEQARGLEQSKPRVKFANKSDLLQAAGVIQPTEDSDATA